MEMDICWVPPPWWGALTVIRALGLDLSLLLAQDTGSILTQQLE